MFQSLKKDFGIIKPFEGFIPCPVRSEISSKGGLETEGGLVLNFLYAYLKSQHVSREIIKPKQHICVISESTLFVSRLGDSDQIQLPFLPGWLLISVSESVVYSLTGFSDSCLLTPLCLCNHLSAIQLHV